MKRRTFLTAAIATVISTKAFATNFIANEVKPFSESKFKILALVFDDYETLDLHGPIEMLGHMKDVEIKLIGATDIVPSYQGPRVLTNLPLVITECDLLIIPGGLGTRKEIDNVILLDWLKSQTEVSTKVFSICTGSVLLAKAGILDGLNATTNKMAYRWVTSISNKVKWHSKSRWVDDGKFLTSSGVSAGTDAALYFISQLRGLDEANRIERLAENSWNSDRLNDPYSVKE